MELGNKFKIVASEQIIEVDLTIAGSIEAT